MTAPAKVKEYLEWMIEFDNVPLKPKPFKNFVKNSMALQRDQETVDGLWTHFEPLLKKRPAATAPRTSPRLTAAAAASPVVSAAADEEAEEEAPKKKDKKKKDKKEKKRKAEESEEEAEEAKKKPKKESDAESEAEEDEAVTWGKAAKTEFKALKAKKKGEEGLSKSEKSRFDALKTAKKAAAADSD
jgi:hypothetical protein